MLQLNISYCQENLRTWILAPNVNVHQEDDSHANPQQVPHLHVAFRFLCEVTPPEQEASDRQASF